MNLDAGVQGLPAGTKESGTRVDFETTDFDIVIETKGYRIAWSRACLCPCEPVNKQTEQPDPNCTICKGSGWFYFAPAAATVDPLKVGKLNTVQTRLTQDAGVIRGIMSGLAGTKVPYDPIGARLEGMSNCTVRAANKLGYYDRITNLDSTIVYSESLDAIAPTLPLKSRYPIVEVNLLRSATQTFTGTANPTATNGDFSISANGDILWNNANPNALIPSAGSKLVIHYLCHPTWLVIEHPNTLRTTPVKSKVKKPLTPQGDPIPLPVQAVIRFEFLPELD